MEKIVVAKTQPKEGEFDSIKVQHGLSVAENIVGTLDQERDNEERKIVQSDEGRKLSDEEWAARKRPE